MAEREEKKGWPISTKGHFNTIILNSQEWARLNRLLNHKTFIMSADWEGVGVSVFSSFAKISTPKWNDENNVFSTLFFFARQSTATTRQFFVCIQFVINIELHCSSCWNLRLVNEVKLISFFFFYEKRFNISTISLSTASQTINLTIKRWTIVIDTL